MVPAAVELTVLRNLATALQGRTGLGLELGARYHVTAFGILGYALMSSRTVGEAMEPGAAVPRPQPHLHRRRT